MTRRLWRGLAVFVLLLVGAGLLIFSGVRHQDAPAADHARLTG
jgi:hypothetical protein